jgi:hypothetical protein
LEDIWEHIVPITFKEIATDILNIEQRRIAVNCLGLEKIYEEVNPELIQSTTLKKETYWVDSDGNLVRKVFDDTYELYQVSEKYGQRVLLIVIQMMFTLLNVKTHQLTEITLFG